MRAFITWDFFICFTQSERNKNNALFEENEIVFPTLLILKKKGTQEVKSDFINTAFEYAFSQPSTYKKVFQVEILNQLNNK